MNIPYTSPPVDDMEAEETRQSPSTGHAVKDYFSTDEIFQRVAASADEEFSRSTQLLIFSGIAAGLSIGLSFVARVTVTAQLPDSVGAGLLGNIVYPIGFLLIVLGRYQLFTENTLTPVTLVLTRIASLPALLKNWGIVLGANMIGAFIIAAMLAYTGIFSPEAEVVAKGFGEHAVATPAADLFWKGVIAGWLVASMVWLVHAARDTVSRFFIVLFVMYLIPSTDLYHCVIGFCEAMYLVLHGDAGLVDAVLGFFVPVLVGNTVGGVVLVAILNYAQTQETRFTDRDCGQLQLTWREWLFEMHTGAPPTEIAPDSMHDGALAVPVHKGDHTYGAPSAPITLIQYGDYECPTSRRIYDIIRSLEKDNELEFRYAYRHFPLRRTHPHAMNAAMAAEAAADQDKFWEMHELLFSNQDALEENDLNQAAETLELDMDRFSSELFSDEHREIVEKDRRSGIESGVRSTGNLFIGDDLYQGEFTGPAIRRLLQRYQPTESSKQKQMA